MHFEYGGVSSRVYDLIIASINKARDLTVSGKAKIVTMHNRRPNADYYMNTRWDNAALTFDLEIVREFPLSPAEERAVTKWLFHQPGYQRLYFDYNDDYAAEWFDIVDGEPIRYYLNCILTEPEKIEGFGGVVGYRCKAICDGPCAWSDEVTVSFEPELDIYTLISKAEAYQNLVHYSTGGNVDLTQMPLVPAEDAQDATWPVSGDTHVLLGASVDFVDQQSVLVSGVMLDEDGNYDGVIMPGAAIAYGQLLLAGDPDTDNLQVGTVFSGEGYDTDIFNARNKILASAKIYYNEVESESVFYVDVDTDLNEYVYPTVVVRTSTEMEDGSSPAFRIWNSSDSTNRVIEMNDLQPQETITLDGEINYVYGDLSSGYDNLTSRNFPRLVDGINEFHLHGSVKSITLIWKNRRYI